MVRASPSTVEVMGAVVVLDMDVILTTKLQRRTCMGFAGFVSTALVAATLLTRANTAHAQQAFEVKFVAARTTVGELVSLPTIGIVPVNTVPLDSNVAEE